MVAKVCSEQELREWVRNSQGLAQDVIQAREIEQSETKRVKAYIDPILRRYRFTDEEGNPIESTERLYLCKDEASVRKFYDEADQAHRDHGFTGEKDHWPNLIAEHNRIKAERTFAESACPLLGLEHPPYKLEHYQHMIELFLKCAQDLREVL